jgi:hypothetical protein
LPGMTLNLGPSSLSHQSNQDCRHELLCLAHFMIFKLQLFLYFPSS